MAIRLTAEEKAQQELAEIRSNPLKFALMFLKDPSNTDRAFKPRWMQKALLGNNCPRLNTVRAQRSSGKTQALVARILWHAFTVSNARVLVIAPFKMHVQRVFEELTKQIGASPELSASVKRQRNNPFEIVLTNGALIRGQSTNVTSKRGGQAVRGEHPSFIYIDEADYLEEADWLSFMSLITPTEPDVVPPEAWATTTPTGKVSYFYKLCEKKEDGAIGSYWHDWWYPARHIPNVTFMSKSGRKLTSADYTINKEGFPEPILGPDLIQRCSGVNPTWTKAQDDIMWASNSEQGYYHEQAAWWGSSVSSVFAKGNVDRAKEFAIAQKVSYIANAAQSQSRSKGTSSKFVLGADVDKRAATPNINVIEYVPGNIRGDETGGTYIVRFREEMEVSDATYGDFQDELVALNNRFQFRHAYVDKQPGDMVVEQLNMKHGLLQFEARQFKESAPIYNAATNQVDNKALKHVMIQTVQRLFEAGRILLAPVSYEGVNVIINNDGSETTLTNQPIWDEKFEEDIRNYSVINVTKTGTPEYTCTNDHRISAFLLAIWCAFEHFDNPYELSMTGAIATISHNETSVFSPPVPESPAMTANNYENFNNTAPVERQYRRQSPDQFRQDFSIRHNISPSFSRRSF